MQCYHHLMTKVTNFFSKHALLFVVTFCLILFSPALRGFFSSDDWFIFRIAQIQNVKEFLNFFSFAHTEQYAGAYRPLSTSVFFWFFYQLFHLNPLPYFLFGLTLFSLTLITLYKLLTDLRFTRFVSLLAVFVYGISATNFTKLNFIGAYNEYFFALFILIALRLALKNHYLYLLFFVLALLSKETAIIFPGLLILTDWFTNRNPIRRFKFYLPTAIITVVYLYFRIFVFKSTEGDSYIFDPSLRKLANTLMWYFLWSLGTPEFLVDYVGSGLKVVPKFFLEFPVWSKLILFQLGLVFSIFTVAILTSFNHLRSTIKPYLFGIGFFIVSLLPVLFFPWHKFTHLLTLPLIGFTLILATAINNKKPSACSSFLLTCLSI